MRIVHVVFSLEVGGQERLIVRMAQALRERGHDVHVVSLQTGGALRRDLEGIPIHDVTKNEGFDTSLYPRLYRVFRDLRPDVVHTHNSVPLQYAIPAARAARVPCTVHTKHGHIAYTRKNFLLGRGTARMAHHFVAVSDDTAKTAAREERPKTKRLSVIENGIPLQRFAPDASARKAIRDELGIAYDAVVVGSVGRLVHEKDYPLLVRAMGPLLGEKVRLVIVGEGTSRPDIEKAIAEVDADRARWITMTGARHDVSRVLTAFDVFVLSSHMEGLPLAIPEAMASGLPVVATAVGGIPGIVPDDTGTLVPHGDDEKLRAAIRRFVDDAKARTAAGEAARRYALGRFAEERMLDRYLALYAQA